MIAWLRRLLGRDVEEKDIEVAPTAAEPQAPPDEAPSPEIARLRAAISASEGAAVLSALRAAEGGPHEREALVEVARLARDGAATDEVARAAAEIARRRGQDEEALGLLRGASSSSSLALRAEILAGRGDLDGAASTLEQALALDISLPGARERLARWRGALGPPAARAATTADATLVTAAPGDVPFRILADAGRGGTASIYEAEDERLGRRVALKVYHRTDGSRDQLAREARVAAHVAGRGIVRVLDASLDDGWIALDWASGGSLRDAIHRADRARLLPAERWLSRVLAALRRVHDAGWVHGDVKPGNVLFHAEGAVLADFGLARRGGEAWTGGTVGYLSPARLAGAPAAPADDLFGLGLLLEDVIAAIGGGGPLLPAVAAACLTGDRETSSAAALAERFRLDESSS